MNTPIKPEFLKEAALFNPTSEQEATFKHDIDSVVDLLWLDRMDRKNLKWQWEIGTIHPVNRDRIIRAYLAQSRSEEIAQNKKLVEELQNGKRKD